MSFPATTTRLYHPELPLQPDLPPAQDTWEQKAAAYIRRNPDAVIEMKRIALNHKRNSPKRIGMKAVAEQYRTSHNLPAEGEYVWNNNYTTYVSHYLMATVPELAGYFKTRRRPGGKMALYYARAR